MRYIAHTNIKAEKIDLNGKCVTLLSSETYRENFSAFSLGYAKSALKRWHQRDDDNKTNE